MLKKLLIAATLVLVLVIFFEGGFYVGFSRFQSSQEKNVTPAGVNTRLPELKEVQKGATKDSSALAQLYSKGKAEKPGETPLSMPLIYDFWDESTVSTVKTAISSNVLVDSKISYTLLGKIANITLHGKSDRFEDAFLLSLKEPQSEALFPVFNLRNTADESINQVGVDKMLSDGSQSPELVSNLKKGDEVKIDVEMNLKQNRATSIHILLLPPGTIPNI